MKNFSTKGVLLFAAAIAVCAFAMPSMASASSWGVVGSAHTFDSPNLAFVSPALGLTSSCGDATFSALVRSAGDLTITTAAFRRCTVVGSFVGSCTQTWIPTGLPWTATAINTTNIQIHRIHIDELLENEPGSTACTAAGLKRTITGTLTNGHWTGNGAGQHEVILNGAPGLFAHSSGLGNNDPQFWTGTIRDTQQTLIVTG